MSDPKPKRPAGGAAILLAAVLAAAPASAWQPVAPGVETESFSSSAAVPDPDGDLRVVRVDPSQAYVTVLRIGADGGGRLRGAAAWGRDFGLAVVANAGMYQEDHETHVGFMQVDGDVVNRAANGYQSAAAFDPVSDDDPPFRLFDLDEVPLEEVRKRYRTVVQNLRLIKRGRENRWGDKGKSWREVALAEDGSGRLLLVSCRTRLTMHRFNEILLQLPIDVQCAQHLEGGHPARLWLSADGDRHGAVPGPPLPNVLAVKVRDPMPEDLTEEGD